MTREAEYQTGNLLPDQAKFVVESLEHSFTTENDALIPVIGNVNFSIRPLEFVALVGPSGCGKSTLLNIMCGLLKPQAGSVTLDEQTLISITPKIGYISQSDSLLPWRTALANVELGEGDIHKYINSYRNNHVRLLSKKAKYPFHIKILTATC